MKDRARQKIRNRNSRLIQKAKRICIICGEREKCCLQFHHLYDKLFTISDGKYHTTEALIYELRKCVVLCSNCHIKVHRGILRISKDKLNFEQKNHLFYQRKKDRLVE